MGFPMATHFIGYKVDDFSIKTWGDEGKDVMFGSSEIVRYVYAIVIVESLYWPWHIACLFGKLNTTNNTRWVNDFL